MRSGTDRVLGTVKWYDPSKGYGFILNPNAGGPDVFVGHRSLDEGVLALVGGEPVEFDIKTIEGKTEACAVRPTQRAGRTGVVSQFEHGWGFISPDGLNLREGVFVHQTKILGDGFRTLDEGEKVTFDLVFVRLNGRLCPQAHNVRRRDMTVEISPETAMMLAPCRAERPEISVAAALEAEVHKCEDSTTADIGSNGSDGDSRSRKPSA